MTVRLFLCMCVCVRVCETDADCLSTAVLSGLEPSR